MYTKLGKNGKVFHLVITTAVITVRCVGETFEKGKIN